MRSIQLLPKRLSMVLISFQIKYRAKVNIGMSFSTDFEEDDELVNL